MPEDSKKLLLFGFGDINQRLARLMGQSAEITAVRRTAMKPEDIHYQQGDVTNSEFVSSLLSNEPDQIVVTLSPSEYSEQGYRSTYLAAIETLTETANRFGAKPEILFVSSSSVYDQNHGEAVDETTLCQPTGHNGRVLLEAEHCLLASGLPGSIIRFSGIYGPGRYRLINNSLSGEHHQPDIIQWTNRIHADDCARVIAHLLNVPLCQRQNLYLASDQLPVPSHVVKGWLYNQITGKNRYPMVSDTDVRSFLGATSTGKRCDSSRLISSGFSFRYPGYQQGFVPILAEYKKAQQGP